MPTALRQFLAHYVQHVRRLIEEVRRWIDDEPARVTEPSLSDPLVECRRLDCGFNSQRILAVVAVGHRRRPQMDHGVISPKLLVERGTDRRPQGVAIRPVRATVHGSPIAEQDRGLSPAAAASAHAARRRSRVARPCARRGSRREENRHQRRCRRIREGRQEPDRSTFGMSRADRDAPNELKRHELDSPFPRGDLRRRGRRTLPSAPRRR